MEALCRRKLGEVVGELSAGPDMPGGRSYGLFARAFGVCLEKTAPATEVEWTLSPSEGAGDCRLEEAALARPFRTFAVGGLVMEDMPSTRGLIFAISVLWSSVMRIGSVMASAMM